MNAKSLRQLTWVFIGLMCAGMLSGQDARQSVVQGNAFYAKGDYAEALNRYEQALTDNPKAVQPKFNKANAYFRLDDLAKAIDLYREVSAESKDMGLVAKAKYNLGNTFFQQGMKQRDSNLQKAVDDLKTAISHWRQTLDIRPEHAQASRNIEVARLIIKDIMDQINKQNQQDPNQPQDPNQGQDQQQQPSGQQNEQQDPNQTPDPNQPNGDPNEPQDQNQEKPPDQQDPNQPQDQQQAVQQDMTAQEILDREQRQKKERQMRQRARHVKVDRDW